MVGDSMLARLGWRGGASPSATAVAMLMPALRRARARVAAAVRAGSTAKLPPLEPL